MREGKTEISHIIKEKISSTNSVNFLLSIIKMLCIILVFKFFGKQIGEFLKSRNGDLCSELILKPSSPDILRFSYNRSSSLLLINEAI